MQINTELDSRHYEKLRQLQCTMGKDLSTLLAFAIDDLYARHTVATGHEALAIFRQNGFIGCLRGDGQLSQNYKKELNLNDKL